MIPVKKTEAIRGVGISDLLTSIEEHQAHLTQTGARQLKAREFLKNEVSDILNERLNLSLMAVFETTSGQEVLQQLVDRTLDPYKAADIISRV